MWQRIKQVGAAVIVLNEVRAVLTAPAMAHVALSHVHDADAAMAGLPWKEKLLLFAILCMALVAVIYLFVRALRVAAKGVIGFIVSCV